MVEKSKTFREFQEDAIDRGWKLVKEHTQENIGYVFWNSVFENGERKLVVSHNPDGIAQIVNPATGRSIPQADENASPTNEDWLDALTVDE